MVCRQLLAAGVRVLLRAQSRLLHHSHLRAVVSHRRPLVDLVLAASRRVAGARLPRHHHRAHHDHHPLQLQRLAAQDLLPQEHRHLPCYVLHHGFRVAARVRVRQLPRSGQADVVDDEGRSPAAAAAAAAVTAVSCTTPSPNAAVSPAVTRLPVRHTVGLSRP